MPWGMSRSNPRPMVRRELHGGKNVFTLTTAEKLPMPSERKQLAHRPRFSESSGRITCTPGNADTEHKFTVKQEIPTPGYHLGSKSTANDDPFSSPIGLRLSSPHPRADATIDDEQQSPLAPLTTSQSGLGATIRSRQVRKEVVQDRNRRSHDFGVPQLFEIPQARHDCDRCQYLSEEKQRDSGDIRSDR